MVTEELLQDNRAVPTLVGGTRYIVCLAYSCKFNFEFKPTGASFAYFGSAPQLIGYEVMFRAFSADIQL